MTYLKKHNIFFISLFIFIISAIVLGFSTRALQIDQKALSSANALAGKGIINNNSNNPVAYKLSSEITRREMLKVMMNISGKGKNINCMGYFKDLSKGDWGCYYAEKALDLGYISANDYFRPNDSVSKIESLKMIFSAKEINVDYGSDWRVGYMNKAVELGITEKFSDYNTRAKRGWIFINADNTITKIPNIAKNIKAFDTTIVFGASMIKESVEKNLIMYPDFKKELVWKNDKELSIKILENTKPNTDVFVNIKAGVKNIYGQTSKEVIIKKFKTLGITKIDFVSPIGKITDLQKNITIRFSKPIVSLTSLDNQDKCPINITPNLKGKCIWITTSTFQFRPDKGFPIGARYNISVQKGITSISGDKTIDYKNFEISTPEFKIINTSNTYYIDKPILIAFNGEISLNNFKENFEINGFKNNELNIKYFETPSTISGEVNINKSIISIIPKYMSWGYDKSYNYKLKQGLKSLRGNISIGNDKKVSFKTSKLLLSSNPFIYNDKNSKNKNLYSNLKFSANKNIITKVNPNILFNFYEEIHLNKAFFDFKGYDFDIQYAKKLQNIDGENILKDNKKSIILSIKNTEIIKNLDIIIKSSKISTNTKDIKLNFTTSTDNKILDYKFINYKKSCLTTKNKIGYNINNNEKFNFNNNKKAINYISEASIYSNDKDCSYEKGENKYIVTTKLNPNKKYNLIINKGLLDINNYSLDKEYNTSFTTLSALNEDKFLSVFDARDLILIPKDLNPLGVVIQSQNLNKISVEICEGDFDISNIDYISNSKCIKKDIPVKNLGFETNYEELNLPEIFGKSFSGNIVTLKIDKLAVDKNEYELNSSLDLTSPIGRGILGGKKTYIRTNKSVVIKSAKNGFMWLLDFKTGENLTDKILKIDSYSKDSRYTGFGKYKGESLNYKGEISFTALDKGLYDLNNSSGFLLITLKSGEQILINSNLGYYHSDNVEVYLTTDKPIYKPGETIKIKGIARKRTAKGYDLFNKIVKLNITNPLYKNIITSDINNIGTFTYEYKLKKDTKLGNYNLNVLNNSISFSVEEYEKPNFKVISKSKKPYYIYGDIPKIDITSEYYMGANLAKGKGSYRVSIKDYKFNSNKNPGYIWGKAPIFWLYNSYIKPNTNISTEIVNNKLFTLNNLGKAILNINTDKTINNKIYTVSSTITDPNTKKSISSSSDFKLLKTNAFIGMKTNNYYYNLGDNAKIDFLALDLDENKLINESIKFKVYKIEYIYNKDTFKQEKNEKLLFDKSLKTDNRGESSINYKIKDYGELRFEISLENGKHAPKEVLLGGKTIKTYYISGQNLVTQIGQEHLLKIIKNKDKYKVGETAEFIISSPVKNVKALITVEKSNKILYKKVIDIKDFSNKFELPIKSEYISNFDLKVFIIKSSTGNILPNYYKGVSSVKVSKDKIKLKAEVKTNKTSYKPGEKAQITLNIKDFDGNPINGEALISIMDESLLALKDNKIKIEDFFYKKQTNQVITNFSLNDLIKKFKINNKKEDLSPKNEISGGGIRGNIRFKRMGLTNSFASELNNLNPSPLRGTSLEKGKAPGHPGRGRNISIRTSFKDLAYYNALVKIVNGKATITVDKLPDNLTTWVVSGYVITDDTKIGSFESKIKVQKDLNLLPSIPRFFVSGDELEITTIAINNTNKDLEINSSLTISNAEIISKPNINNIKANSKALLVWKVKITPENIKDVSDIIISVNTNKISDSVKLSKKIIPYSTPEYTFTNGFTNNLSYEEKINLPNSVDQNLGRIDISLGATILTNLLDSINSIASTPLNNFYSTVSAFKKAGVLKLLYKSIGEENKYNSIEIQDYNNESVLLNDTILNIVKEINSYQNKDGGMMVYKNCITGQYIQTCSNFDLTGDFLASIKDLKKAGYIVNQNIIDKALSYYKRELENKIIKYEQDGNIYRNIDVFYKILGYDDIFLKKYLLSSRFIDTNYNFSNILKLKLILILKTIDKNNGLIKVYIKEFGNKTMIEARGTLLPSSNNILSTSLGLRVFINEGEGEKLIIENMARWLMAQKGVNGEFSNGSNTVEVIKTITEYINYTGELKGLNFEAKGYLNSKEIISGSFDKSNKFSSQSKSFTLKDYLKFGSDNSLGFEKTGTGKLYYDVGLRYFLPINEIEARDEGIIIKREYYKYREYKNAFKKECIEPIWFGGYYRGGYTSKIGFPGGYCRKIKVKNITSVKSGNKGDLLVGVIEIIIPSERNNVMVNDFIPAGAEIVNINLNTTSQNIKDITGNNRNNYWRQSFSHIENKDDRLVLFTDKLYAGTYKYTYVLKLNHKGKYHNRPAVVEELKKPEIWGRTKGELFEIK